MEKIHEHLLGRPFAPIFQASKEQQNEMALKIMCVIDYFIAKQNLNEAIDEVPKLREQLLRWSSFETFRFYSYSAPPNWFRNEMLQCKRCEFIGPYLTVLTHQAINHDLHTGLKKCVWCDRMEYQAHLFEHTEKECYEMYLAKKQLQNQKYTKVVVDFYNMLRSIGSALEVKIKRTEVFAGIGYKSQDYLLDLDDEGDVDQSLLVYSSKRKHKREINIFKLNQLLRKAMEHFHGSDAHTFYGAFTNTCYTEPVYNALGPNTRPSKTQKTSHTEPATAESRPPTERSAPLPPNTASSNTSQAFAAYMAAELDEIKNPDVKRRTKRLVQDVIANGQEEDRNTTLGLAKGKRKY